MIIRKSFTSMVWAQILVYALVSYTLSNIGHGWDSWAFWVILALMWALESAVRTEVIDGVAKSMALLTLAVEQYENKIHQDKLNNPDDRDHTK